MALFLNVAIFWMVAARLTGFLVLSPGLHDAQVPMVVRGATVAWLACFLTPVVATMTTVDWPINALFTGMVSEFFLGLGLGLVTRLILTTVQIGGALIDNELALSAAQQLSPQAGISGGVVGRIQLLIGLAYFWASDYFSALLLALEQSFRILPIGHISITANALDQIARVGDELFVAGIVIASPIALLTFSLTLALGFLSRTVQHLNIFGESFNLRVLVGELSLLLFLPLLLSFNRYWMEHMLPAAADYFKALTT